MVPFAVVILITTFYQFVFCSQHQKCGSQEQCLCNYERDKKRELAITQCTLVEHTEIPPSFCYRNSYKGVELFPTTLAKTQLFTNKTLLLDVKAATKLSDNFFLVGRFEDFNLTLLHLRIDGATSLKNISALNAIFRQKKLVLAAVFINNSPLINLADVHDLIWRDNSK